tara:strand:+ start:284 stop:1420 length:1137 start_codon:yes stop_codon:yes gene_type:complete
MTFNLINHKIDIINADAIILNYTDKSNIYISKSLHNYLFKLKKQIDEYQNEWDNIKRYINPYEFINTRVPGEKTSVCKYNPISRSFFKLIEICDCFNFNKYFSNYKNVKTLHLAEAPGGFIEAIIHYFKNNTIISNMLAISLINEHDNTPSWNYNYFDKYKSVNIENNIYNCDITTSNVFNKMIQKYPYYYDIITSDGGFDFSGDFNNQELLSQPLIFSEILYAIAFQKKGGIFVLKMFDCFTKLTVQLLYLLSSLYEKICIFKPNTSRLANSEKYIICINYINTQENQQAFIQKIPSILDNINNISSIFDFELPLYFIQKIEEINAILGQQQLEAISSTIILITHKTQSDKLNNLKENNLQKCINWCIKHKFHYYDF